MTFVSRITVGALVGAVVTAAAIAPALGQETTTLRIQSAFPTSGVFFQNLEYFKERVETMSSGRLKLELLAPGTVVPPFESLDAVARGVLDGAHTAPAYWVGKDRSAALFGPTPGGPFGMDIIDYMGWIYDAGGLEFYNEFYRDVLQRDVQVFPLTWVGQQALGWFEEPVESWADLEGRQCRQTGITAEVFSQAGMSPVNMPGGEIVPAGERGVIDCAEWVGPAEDMAVGFHTIWKHYYLGSMHEPATAVELLINGETWRSLPEDLQAIIRSATLEATYRSQMMINRQNADALIALREEHGVNIYKTPEEINIKILESWDKIAETEAAQNPFFKKVYDSQREYASKVVPSRSYIYVPYDLAARYYWSDRIEGGGQAQESKN
jgi:TRAP-type mannitol/chloroaromatic compound transport system substrate-binding protein